MIEKLLNDRIGLCFDSLGRKNVAAAISAQMEKHGVAYENCYLDLVSRSPMHFDELCRSMLIPETWFFRYAESFAFLSAHAKEHLASSGRHLHVLSIPCSTGEEPYSIAMTLLDSEIDRSHIHVDAVDASGTALETAGVASYGPNSFRGGLPEPMRRFFRTIGERQEVRKEVWELVLFRKNSIFDHEFRFHGRGGPPCYDIIFCRNMLIYFSPEKQAEAISILTGMLADGGILFLGHAESGMINGNDFISAKYPSSFAFRKRSAAEKSHAAAEREKKVTPVRPKIRGAAEPRRRPAQPDTPSAHGPAAPSHAGTQDGGQLLRKAAEMADKGRLKDAEALCLGYIEHDKLNPFAYYVLGVIGLSDDRLPEAEKAFSRALYLDPDYYEALVQLALIKERQGDRENATRIRKRAERTTAGARQ